MPWNLLLVHNFKLENSVKSLDYFPILAQTLLSLNQSENQATSLLPQCGASSHKQPDLSESPEGILQGYALFCSDRWNTDETYEVEVLAVVEQQYLP